MKSTVAKKEAGTHKSGSPFFQKRGDGEFWADAHEPFFDYHSIQPKLSIGQPNDQYEREADAMADKVVQRLSKNDAVHENTNNKLVQPKPSQSVSITPILQTKCAACEKEERLQKKEEEEKEPLEDKLQRKPIFESNALPEDEPVQRKCAECEKEEKLQKKDNNFSALELDASPSIENSLATSKGSGSHLHSDTRLQMETSFGADFSQVRIHNDSSAIQMSKDLHAQAFTHGSDIFFNQGKYDTGSTGGKHLLAHELTHVIQQGSARPPNTISRAPEDENPEKGLGAPGANLDPAAITAEAQKDIESDDLGGIKVPDETKEEEDIDLGGVPETEGEEGEIGGETAEAEIGPEDKNLEEDTGGQQVDEGGSNQTIPENTPVTSTGDKCPTIAPEFPEPPANAELEEDNDSFFQELIGFAPGIIGAGGFGIVGIFGGGPYFIWRRLPMWVKVRIIDFVIDRIISGAYWGKLLGPYIGMGTGLISAVFMGFFKRLRQMPDVQKVRLFEKFGKIVLGGDVRFTFGLLKGILIGFFLDGVLSIVQMIIDLICIVPKIIDFFRTIGDFIKKVPYEIQLVIANIQEFFSSIGDTVKNAVSELKELIKNPDKIIALVNTIYESAAAQAEKLGSTMADTFIRYAALPAEALGTIAGRIGGRLLFEGLLIYFTGGGEAVVGVVKSALREIGKVLARIGREIFNIIKKLGAVFSFVKNIISKIIKFLTPLLKVVARLARRVIDKIRALFNLFRKMCRPGTVICKVIKPNCRANRVRRLGFNPVHDAYVTRTTGQTMDYRVRAPFFGVRVPCNYDARLGALRVLVEGKTGYRYLPYLQSTNPSLFRFIMFRLNEQRFRCGAIAARCGYAYIWYMQDAGAARFLAFRWHGFPPVLHMP